MVVKWYKDERNDDELFIACDSTNGVFVNAKIALEKWAYEKLERAALATDKATGSIEL